ncbi:Hypothetical predicted protein [Cloeon dipterum]|nr:Hypothetical predicted protein [Cloeon dipterum]
MGCISDADVEEHYDNCELWNDSDIEEEGDYYCISCKICWHMYRCNCSDQPLICKHIREVHMYNERIFKDQRPYNLLRTTEEDLKRLEEIKKNKQKGIQDHFSLVDKDFLKNLKERFSFN